MARKLPREVELVSESAGGEVFNALSGPTNCAWKEYVCATYVCQVDEDRHTVIAEKPSDNISPLLHHPHCGRHF